MEIRKPKKNPQKEDSVQEFACNSAEETFNLGKKMAKHLHPGSVTALDGVLGSGKTVLVKGIAAGLGIKETVTSPTYTIISEYPFNYHRGQLTLYHVDAYRLTGEKDFEEIGGNEILSGNGICIIEWSGIIKNLLPEKKAEVLIEITGQSSRLVKVKGL